MQSLHDEVTIEDYLESVRKRLNPLPAEERACELVEIRTHLTELAKAHAELGATEAEALHAALRQFGDPRKVGVELRRAWQRGQRQEQPGTVLSAAACAMGVTMVMYVVSTVLRSVVTYSTNGYAGMGAALPKFMLGLWAFGCLQCLFTGYITGRRAPRRAVAGMLLSSTLFTGLNLCMTCRAVLPHLPPGALRPYLSILALSYSLGVIVQLSGVMLGRRRFLADRRRARARA
jgi:hypothetical protein